MWGGVRDKNTISGKNTYKGSSKHHHSKTLRCTNSFALSVMSLLHNNKNLRAPSPPIQQSKGLSPMSTTVIYVLNSIPVGMI